MDYLDCQFFGDEIGELLCSLRDRQENLLERLELWERNGDSDAMRDDGQRLYVLQNLARRVFPHVPEFGSRDGLDPDDGDGG